MIHGWLNVYKPHGMNSTRVVTLVRKALDKNKIGHGGTLDPLAEGILPLALGEATKTVAYIMDKTKTYEFEVTWGSQTTTDDVEGEVIETSAHRPTREDILSALETFTGIIDQVPPNFSAVMVDGHRAYKLARKNEVMELKSRQIFVDKIQLVSTENIDRAVFEVTCGKGTYVRSLARDLALYLGTKGHVSMLKRVRVGKFSLANAISLEKIQELGHKVLAEGYVYPIADVLDDIPAVCVSAEQEVLLLHGRTINLTPLQAEGLLPGKVLCRLAQGKSLAIGTYDSGIVQPNRVFNKT
jgi:tRNA pseudouridine55 synthase